MNSELFKITILMLILKKIKSIILQILPIHQKNIMTGDNKAGRDIVNGDQITNNYYGVNLNELDEDYEPVQEADFIKNTGIIASILVYAEPTPLHQKQVLDIIKSHKSYEKYFWEQLESPYWLPFLKKKGYFHHKHNPSPLNEGESPPFWMPLQYLEKVSKQIKNGNHHNYIPNILEIIDDVSKNPEKNDKTWYWFLLILENLPVDRIPKPILDFIPVWLENTTSDYGYLLRSLMNQFIPKFLKEMPAQDEIDKANQILNYFFTVGTKQPPFQEAFISLMRRIDLLEWIAKYASQNIFLQIANNLKQCILEDKKGTGYSFDANTQNYHITFWVETPRLEVSLIHLKDPCEIEKENITNFTIENYKSDSNQDLVAQLVQKTNLIFQSDEQRIFEENLKELLDYEFYPNCEDISMKIGRNYKQTLINLYVNCLESLLTTAAKEDSNKTKNILQKFLQNKDFKLRIFQRLALSIIAKHWKHPFKPLFWKAIEQEDLHRFFSIRTYKLELYNLLKNNINQFSVEEKRVLEKIITNEPKSAYHKKDPTYWRLRWYEALNADPYFQNGHKQLTELADVSENHFEKSGVGEWSPYDRPPLSVDRLLTMPHAEIAQYLRDFSPTNDYQAANISGLGAILSDAVQKNPTYFQNDLKYYQKIPYLYVYRMLEGFRDATSKQQPINHHAILVYCQDYILDADFGTDKLKKTDRGLNVTADLVKNQLAEYLITGFNTKKVPFEAQTLPIIENILTHLVSVLESKEDSDAEMDYARDARNTTAGKILHALLFYAMHIAKHSLSESSVKWSDAVKKLFDACIEKKIVEVSELQGHYYDNYYYLDKDWFLNRIELNYKVSKTYWEAFMTGLLYNCAPNCDELYLPMQKHYQKAVQLGFDVPLHTWSGMTRHLCCYFLWDKVDVGDESWFDDYLKRCNKKQIVGIIHYLAFKYQLETTLALEAKIKHLWEYLSSKYKGEQEIHHNLLFLIHFILVLDYENTELIIHAIQVSGEKEYLTETTLENFTRLSKGGKPKETALHLARLIKTLPINPYIYETDIKTIQDLITFLYENNQKEIANEICNRYAQTGVEFLRSTYNDYNK
jgi:hypothetical protein